MKAGPGVRLDAFFFLTASAMGVCWHGQDVGKLPPHESTLHVCRYTGVCYISDVHQGTLLGSDMTLAVTYGSILGWMNIHLPPRGIGF